MQHIYTFIYTSTVAHTGPAPTVAHTKKTRETCTQCGTHALTTSHLLWHTSSHHPTSTVAHTIYCGTHRARINCGHCNTLQRTATRCNTLQHAATRCNALQHIATLCNTLQHTAPHCNTLQHTATYCNALQHTSTHHPTATATHCNTLQHTATHIYCGTHNLM